MNLATADEVVVTGLGAVCALGGQIDEIWNRLVAGEDGSGPVTLFDVSGCRCRRAAEVKNEWLSGGDHRTKGLARATRLLIPAAREALEQAEVLGTPEMDGIALSISTTAGAMAWAEEFLRGLVAHRPGGLLSFIARQQPQQQLLDLEDALRFRAGITTIIGNACASGANAVGHAADLLLTGQAEIVIAGGYEALSELLFLGFDCLQATSVSSCRPFDRGRDGLMLGEGAAVLIMETSTHAARRGAPALARLAGYGHATDLKHLTQPSADGAALTSAMRMATRRAHLAPAEIGYVNAHGTATSLNDTAEVAAYDAIFPEFARADVRVSSTKAAVGHTLGAAGALEAVFTVQALRHQRLPPQIATRDPMPEIASNLVTVADSAAPNLRYAASVNLGFGGSNAALIFASCP
jgi:3-oxoacyl-[acyl-carrier-protein] synthase II